MSEYQYVHGYDDRESQRLSDQSNALARLLHHDTRYPAGAKVLEAGCGVGSQTVHLAAGSPQAELICIDISEQSVAEAKLNAEKAGITNASFTQADLMALPFEPESFDHVFVCFVLEHLSRPEAALESLKKVLKPGGTITVIEGDHGSTYFHPDSPNAQLAVQALVDAQLAAGGDANIGRRLYPLINNAGFKNTHVSPRMVYVDDSNPQLVQGFTLDTFTAMVAGARASIEPLNIIDMPTFDRGVEDLAKCAAGGGTFCYTFFKAVATK